VTVPAKPRQKTVNIVEIAPIRVRMPATQPKGDSRPEKRAEGARGFAPGRWHHLPGHAGEPHRTHLHHRPRIQCEVPSPDLRGARGDRRTAVARSAAASVVISCTQAGPDDGGGTKPLANSCDTAEAERRRTFLGPQKLFSYLSGWQVSGNETASFQLNSKTRNLWGLKVPRTVLRG
jgi:hypothetical protein